LGLLATLQNHVLSPGYLTLIQIAEKLDVSNRYIFKASCKRRRTPAPSAIYSLINQPRWRNLGSFSMIKSPNFVLKGASRCLTDLHAGCSHGKGLPGAYRVGKKCTTGTHASPYGVFLVGPELNRLVHAGEV
jgi:hypothetical protein